MGPPDGKLSLEVVDVVGENLAMSTFLPCPSELVGAPGRCLALPSRVDDPLRGACHGCQEVGRRLLLGALEAKSLKICFCFRRLAEEDLAAFVENDDLVEQLF